MVRRFRPKMELGMGIHLEMARVEWSRARDQGRKKSIGDKVKSFYLWCGWSHEKSICRC
jgi:hypothetical protein